MNDTFPPMGMRPNGERIFICRPRTDFLNNPFFLQRIFKRTNGRTKSRTEARANNYIEHLKTINSATVPHEADEDRRAQSVSDKANE
jgi:hypothetical protein